jgi:hypothetical protein
VAGVLVGLLLDGKKMFVAGLDPATGRQLWKQEASPSELTPGITLSVTVVGDRVVYFRPIPTGPLYAQLVVADPKTGKDLAVAGPHLFSSSPAPCSQRPEDRDVCTVSRAYSIQESRPYRLKMDTREYVPEDAGVARYRSLGPNGLVDLAVRNPEYLAVVRDGKVAWRTPVAQAFPPGFSTDNGWNWRYRGEEHMFVGSVFGPGTELPGGGVRADLSVAGMAALSETDGSVLWRDNGSAIDCLGTVSVSAPVRCRYKGIATYSREGPPSFEGLDVTVEGYDRRSGATTWSAPVGAVPALAGGASPSLATAGQTTVLVQTPTGPVVLDLTTGARQAPAANAAFWCATATQTFEYETPFVYESGRTVTRRVGAPVAFTCDAGTKPAAGLPPWQVTKAVGADAGGVVVVATATGYTGYKAG